MKYGLLALCIAVGLSLHAQTSFRISRRTFCYYNADTKQPDNCSAGIDYTCTFVLNADSTGFDQVFVDSKNHYDVLDKEYDADDNEWFYEVKTENNNTIVFNINYTLKVFVIMSKPIKEMVDNDAITLMLVDSIIPQ